MTPLTAAPRHTRQPRSSRGSHGLPTPPRRWRRLLAVLAPLALAGLVGGLLVASHGVSATGALQAAAAGEVSLWPADAQPPAPADPDQRPVEVGTSFRTSEAGAVTGVRFYRHRENAGPHTGHLWDDQGRLLATVPFTSETYSGWQIARLDAPVTLQPGRWYVVSYHAPSGRYADDQWYFGDGRQLFGGPLQARAGVYAYGEQARYPTDQWRASAYYADVLFAPDSSGPLPTAGPISPTLSPTSPPPSSPAPTTTPAPTTSAPTTVRPTSTTTPAPTSTSSTSSPPSGGCAYPSCFPTTANTGVPASTALTAVNGDLEITQDGARVDAKDIRGDLIVRADNVRVTRTRIQGVVFAHTTDQSGLVLEDSEITAKAGQSYSVYYLPPISDGNYTLRRVHVHRWQDGPRSGRGSVVIEDSLVDELAYASGEHPDAFQLYGPGARVSVVLRHSTFSGCAGNSSDRGSSAMFWSDHPGAGSTLLVTQSRFVCGQFSIRINDANAGSGVVADVHDNVVVKGSYVYGPVESNNSVLFNGTEGIKWARNSYDTGGEISLSRC
jgi:hypothetical protein